MDKRFHLFKDAMDKKILYQISYIMWQKLKGKPIPKSWSDEDREQIIKRYWHKMMESE